MNEGMRVRGRDWERKYEGMILQGNVRDLNAESAGITEPQAV